MPKLYHLDNKIICGCDEAGRGCLAGPVVAAAVILPDNFKNSILTDSKQVKESDRIILQDIIKTQAIAFGIGVVSHDEIDRLNILKASFLAMHRAINQLPVRPAHLIIDGNRFVSYPGIPHQCIVKGDSKYLQISAASILAKVHRDNMMTALAKQYPHYGWDTNKGYPTNAHREAIREYGATPLHRKSFKLLPDKEQTLFD